MPYLTRDQMQATWTQLAINHPNMVSSEIVGKTVEGRDILLYKIGNPIGGRVMFSGGTHGFEKAAVEVLLMFADWLVNSTEPEATRIREHNYVLILPILDVDRYPSSGLNANFVNLYRNFNFRWGGELASTTKIAGTCGTCSLLGYTTRATCEAAGGNWTTQNFPTDERVACANSGGTWSVCTWSQYCGPYVESEPETLALKNVWLNYLPKNYLDMHVGDSGFTVWYSWLADVADKQKMIDVGVKYRARAIAQGYPDSRIFKWAENAGSSGCPVSASYHNTGKKTLGYVIEITTQNPAYETIAEIHFPNFKQVAITLAQESETPMHVLTIASTIGGNTNPQPGTYEIPEGQTCSIEATPQANYRFVKWLLDGAEVIDNPIIVMMDGNHTLEPIFTQISPQTSGYTLPLALIALVVGMYIMAKI